MSLNGLLILNWIMNEKRPFIPNRPLNLNSYVTTMASEPKQVVEPQQVCKPVQPFGLFSEPERTCNPEQALEPKQLCHNYGF